MAKAGADSPFLLLNVFTDNFAEIDYSAVLGGPFDLTNPVQAMLLRAQNRHMGVIIQLACVPLEQFYGDSDNVEQSDEQSSE